jgi:hypothetical protein
MYREVLRGVVEALESIDRVNVGYVGDVRRWSMMKRRGMCEE